LNNTFLESVNCERYPLSVSIDTESGLTVLTDPVDTKLLFDKYLYISGTSLPFIHHCQDMYQYISKFIKICSDDLIVDIGGNDGTLLDCFRRQIKETVTFLNIDPSDVSTLSLNKNIFLIQDYFSEKVVNRIEKRAKIITTTNVFQHLVDIDSFVKNIKILLDHDGFWCLEFPYWANSIKTLQFDQIYHEHIYYYNVKPLKQLFESKGLRIFDISEQEIHGGSLRLLICNQENNKFIESESVQKFINYESEITEVSYFKWEETVKKHTTNCYQNILNLSKENEIVGFGAAAKGCVFLNYLGLDYKQISYVIDDTEIKQNKFIPGTGIEILHRDRILKNQPDYILILAHNFKEYIIKSLREFGYTNKFIVCLPEFEIID
jgi:hypothetical protein